MNLITALDVNATGLTAQRKRVEVASSNMANSQTTRTEEGDLAAIAIVKTMISRSLDIGR